MEILITFVLTIFFIWLLCIRRLIVKISEHQSRLNNEFIKAIHMQSTAMNIMNERITIVGTKIIELDNVNIDDKGIN